MSKKLPFTRIFIHCSDLDYGTAVAIADGHRKKGWKTIGYHECVSNGYPAKSWFDSKTKVPYLEGAVEIGRIIDADSEFEPFEQGAHVAGHNEQSYGICMIGKYEFSDIVLNRTLEVVRYRMSQFGIKPKNVLGHYECDSGKTCPNIDMNIFRKHLIDGTNYGESPIKSDTDKKGSHAEKQLISNWFCKIFSNFFSR